MTDAGEKLAGRVSAWLSEGTECCCEECTAKFADFIRAELERAAGIADKRRNEHCPSGPGCEICYTAMLIAAAIRKLKE